MKNPLSLVKDKFGDKAKLVEAVQKLADEDLWVARTNKDKGLGHVSNAKLLRLHGTFTAVKEKFGTRDKLIASILELEKRTKDEGYKSRISAYPVPRLFDMYKSVAKRLGKSAPEAPAEKKPAAKAKAAVKAKETSKETSAAKPKKAPAKKPAAK